MLLRRIARQAAYDAEMYGQVKHVIDDLIGIAPEKAEGLQVAKLDIEAAEVNAQRRANRDRLSEMLRP